MQVFANFGVPKLSASTRCSVWPVRKYVFADRDWNRYRELRIRPELRLSFRSTLVHF